MFMKEGKELKPNLNSPDRFRNRSKVQEEPKRLSNSQQRSTR
jgi:hypothetical protein